jgi:hypothetical protein
MDSHLHLLLRIDCEEAENWSEQEVVQRWFRLYPPRGADPWRPITKGHAQRIVFGFLTEPTEVNLVGTFHVPS